MDILHLIDRLEELFNESRAIPFTHNVVVDEEKMLDLIDQMRVAIPEEMKKAQQVLTQRDRIMAQAQEEANRTLALAREKGEQLLERDSIVQNAQSYAEQKATDIITDAEQTRIDADQYVIETLTKLELELERYLNQVRNGISTLKETHLESQQQTTSEGP